MSETTPLKVTVPPGKIGLSFLLVSGERKDNMLFDPKDTVDAVRKSVFDDWPKEWPADARPPTPANLQILYRGRFFDVNSTLESNKLPVGDMTVVHLVVKAAVAAEEAEKPKEVDDGNSACRCCIIS
ncbi:hypothetical protein RI367_000073 [Sorochytrium milnesiophthora]